MSKRPVLEAVDDDDIDNMDMDIAQFDPSLNTPIAPLRQGPTVTRSQDSEPSLFPNNINPLAELAQQSSSAPASQGGDVVNPDKFSAEEREKLRTLQVLYPCYFDKNRSHKEGRRVSRDKAVENPLAYTISNACRQLKMPVLLELDKTHPQDFGNPGRVRVLIKENGEPTSDAKTKRGFLNTIAEYLQQHPTTLQTIDPKGGIPCSSEYKEGDFKPEAIPKVKGFKMNTIAPLHSPLTVKHPMTKAIYDQQPPPSSAVEAPKQPKQPKKKIMKIRG